MRTKWEADKAHEADELRELRESYRELRRMHIETKDALDKANTRLDVLRLQVGPQGGRGGAAGVEKHLREQGSRGAGGADAGRCEGRPGPADALRAIGEARAKRIRGKSLVELCGRRCGAHATNSGVGRTRKGRLPPPPPPPRTIVLRTRL